MVSYNTQNQNLRYASSRLPKPGCHHQNLPCSLTPHGVSLKHIKPRSSCGHHRNIGCRARYDDSEWRSPPPAPTRSAPPSNSYLDTTQQAGNGVFVLLLINILIFLADKLLHVPLVQSLYLYHSNPQWYQFITCCFCHSSWEHLSTNMFMLLVFGRYVEEEGGVLGLWLTYLICGVGMWRCVVVCSGVWWCVGVSVPFYMCVCCSASIPPGIISTHRTTHSLTSTHLSIKHTSNTHHPPSQGVHLPAT